REERRVAGGEHSTLTDAQHVDAVDSRSSANEIDAVVEITRNVIIDGEPTLRARGQTPVDEVHVEALREELAHERSVRFQVDHLETPDQGIDDEHGHRV